MDKEPQPSKKPTEATFDNAPELRSIEVATHPTPREILDPNGTLPEIEFVEGSSHKSPDLEKTQISLIHGGEIIGNCTLQINHGSMKFDGIKIAEAIDGKSYRGKGYGLATYLKAIELAQERDLPFETQDWNLTEDAVKIWKILKNAGVAEEIEPFRPDTETRHPNRFKGKYRVPPPEAQN